jgi:flagellar basal body rod protein FlgB
MIPKIQPINRVINIHDTKQYQNKKQSEFEKVLEAEKKRKCNHGQIKITRSN